MPTAPPITVSARLSVGLAELLLTEIPEDKFARLATGANGPIQSNHPAFIFGHLSLYPPRMIAMLGQQPSEELATPADQAKLFERGAKCLDDTHGTIYPNMQILTGRFRKGYKALINSVEKADDQTLAQPTPEEKLRERFPTLGVAVNFMLNNHLMLHLGQVSAWRRIQGLGPVM